jgi:hypothetical protein
MKGCEYKLRGLCHTIYSISHPIGPTIPGNNSYFSAHSAFWDFLPRFFGQLVKRFLECLLLSNKNRHLLSLLYMLQLNKVDCCPCIIDNKKVLLNCYGIFCRNLWYTLEINSVKYFRNKEFTLKIKSIKCF